MKRDPHQPHEWLALLFSGPSYQKSPTLVSLVVDPSVALGAFSQNANRKDSALVRTYLVSPDGSVLTHSVSSYTGMSFATVPVFSGGVATLFSGTRPSGSLQGRAVDGLDVIASYARVGELPMALVIERVSEIQAAGRGNEIRGLGQILILGGILCVALVFILRIIRRRTDDSRVPDQWP